MLHSTSSERLSTMSSTKILFVVFSTALIALFLGMGLGALAGPTPDIQEKVVEVEVPGPTKEVEVEVVKEVEVPVVPQACLDAISSAEELGEVAGGAFADMAGWPTLVPLAFEAGLLQDQASADDILKQMDSLNAKHAKSIGEVERVVSDFNSAKAGCRG